MKWARPFRWRFDVLIALGALMWCLTPARAAIHVFEWNVLVGADDVLVGVGYDRHLYDVRFIDGTCVAIFSGCDAESDFAAGGSPGRAYGFAVALRQVLYPAGAFNGIVAGCPDQRYCSVYIPYSVDSMAQVLGYRATVSGLSRETWSAASDTSEIRYEVYALWTSVGTVPEPRAHQLLIAGVLLLAALIHRRARRRRS
jgi:hypothetical protein